MAAKQDDKKADADPDDIVVGDIKPVVSVARQSGHMFPFAIALSKDKAAILVVDKKLKPKKLRDALLDQAKKIGVVVDPNSLRFGRAKVVDKLMIFTPHKDAPGALRVPLLSRVKGAGCGCNEIMFAPADAALEAEPDDDVATAPAAGGAAPAATAAGPGGGGDAELLREQTAKLKALMQQIPGIVAVMPGLRNDILTVAAAANEALKRPPVQDAVIAIDVLDEAIKEAALQAAAQDTGHGPNAQVVADKAQQVWGACLELAAREVEKLRTEVTAAYRDHGFGAQVDKFFKDQIDPAMQKLESKELTSKLVAASRSDDAAERRQLLTDGIKIVEKLQGVITSDRVLQKLDDNPFTKLVIAKTASSTLGKLKQTLQSAVRV